MGFREENEVKFEIESQTMAVAKMKDK